jgi:hypothetical protein
MSIRTNRKDERSEHMTFLSMQHMPLSSAYLCEDCHCVGNCAGQCPACASTALLCLAGILNREETAEVAPASYALMIGHNASTASIAA